MRLSRIRIAGFKSFVDPTDIRLPSARVGIVGPNGCGKSNTIDAVRWVMGETSAKHLRGESMDDVIFTGSSTRKPVGQASVELVFDNADGSLGGEYAQYAEISVKREVTRDGQSKYLLNNTRCRRRDIRDIFLGTGLGPRSYAIIEQGMISRLIEAKPEDLRIYLEEAAGISKYKERRKETETRIRHTRDNLDRLDDLREEVDKQLNHLQRQASTAEKFQLLKAEERQKRGELLGLRRRAFLAQRDGQAAEIARRETELEGAISELRSAEAAIEQARQQQVDATDRFNTVQADFYRIGADVTRLEQQIEHARDTRRQQSREFAEVEKELGQARSHQADDTRRIAEINASIESDEPAYDQLQDSQRVSAELLVQAEQELQEWRGRRDGFRQKKAEVAQTAQVERSRIDQFERSIGNATTRVQRLEAERETLVIDGFERAIETAIGEEVAAAAEESRLQASLAGSADRQQLLRESIRQLTVELNESRGRAQAAIGRLAALEALQQAALEPDSSAADAWLHLHELDQRPRLAQCITTEPGWEKAVELVLAPQLDAITLDGDALLARCLDDLPAAQLMLVSAGRDAVPRDGRLSARVQGLELGDFLDSVYTAESLAEALVIRERLAPGESVITRDGLWFGPHWLRISRSDAQDSVLLRETEITELRAEIGTLESRVDSLEAKLTEQNTQLEEHETRRETILHAYNDAVRRVSDVKSGLQSQRQQLAQVESRRRQLAEELAESGQLRAQESEQLEAARAKWQAAVDQLETLADEERLLNEEQGTLEAALAEARERARADRDAGQALAIRVESLRSSRAATEQNLARMQARIEQLAERFEILNTLMADTDDDPVAGLEDSLKQSLDARLAAETALTAARTQLDGVDHRLREHEQARVRHDSRAQAMREDLQNARMASQEVLVRLKTIEEQLVEHDYVVDEVLNDIPGDATAEAWAEELEALERRIQRLGPINLAAIDELAEQQQRKEYLDTQHADVTEALATLEQAIAKIDRETRSRFKDTFDKVNAKVEEFFPRLFGGGKGALEMTGDDLLSTGVSVVAQPPGKRVSNIQLLSGGEKALTAVALVFAFFELNPSPFCMLDEVDAPLDDANVGRFCQLVKEMSERVQFIFITHNKVTMEMADQLMGVTMNEPGVSRLVAVDVQEAVELAGV